jgi:hypothetical protein
MNSACSVCTVSCHPSATFLATSSRYVQPLPGALNSGFETNALAAIQERKYFDSGDYALSKAGKASDVGVTNIGSQHPQPENIPHVHSPSIPGAIKTSSSSSTAIAGGQGSPVKDTSFNVVSPPKSPLQSESSEAKSEAEAGAQSDSPKDDAEKASTSPKPVPSRWQATTAE